jgi:hypothetical protein
VTEENLVPDNPTVCVNGGCSHYGIPLVSNESPYTETCPTCGCLGGTLEESL